MSCHLDALYVTITPENYRGVSYREKVDGSAFDLWTQSEGVWRQVTTRPGDHAICVDDLSEPIQVAITNKGSHPAELDAILVGAVLDPSTRGGRQGAIEDLPFAPDDEAYSRQIAHLAAIRVCALANSGDKGLEQISLGLLSKASAKMTASQWRSTLRAPVVSQALSAVKSPTSADVAKAREVIKAILKHPAGDLSRHAHQDDKGLLDIVSGVGDIKSALASPDPARRIAAALTKDRKGLVEAAEQLLVNGSAVTLDSEPTSGGGFPAMWESGGGASNTGEATIIARPDGTRPYAAHIKTRGHRAGGDQAKVPVAPGFYVFSVTSRRDTNRNSPTYNRRLFSGRLVRVVSAGGVDHDGRNIDVHVDGAVVSVMGPSGWEPPLPEFLLEAENAAKRKTLAYHTRSPFWVVGDRDEVPKDGLTRPRGVAQGNKVERAKRYAALLAEVESRLEDTSKRLEDVPTFWLPPHTSGSSAVAHLVDGRLELRRSGGGSGARAYGDRVKMPLTQDAFDCIETQTARLEKLSQATQGDPRTEDLASFLSTYPSLGYWLRNVDAVPDEELEDVVDALAAEAAAYARVREEGEHLKRELRTGEYIVRDRYDYTPGVDPQEPDRWLERLRAEYIERERELEFRAQREEQARIEYEAEQAREMEAARKQEDRMAREGRVESISLPGKSFNSTLSDHVVVTSEGESRSDRGGEYDDVTLKDLALVASAYGYDSTTEISAAQIPEGAVATRQQAVAALEWISNYGPGTRRGLTAVMVERNLAQAVRGGLSDREFEELSPSMRVALAPLQHRVQVEEVAREIFGVVESYEILAQGVDTRGEFSYTTYGEDDLPAIRYENRDASLVGEPVVVGDGALVKLMFEKSGDLNTSIVYVPLDRLPEGWLTGS